jgi:ketosteroid isomerase-like protein
LLIWFFLKGEPPTADSEKRAETSPPQAQPSPSPPAVPPAAAMAPEKSLPALQQQLEQVLAGIREANQKKDLSQLLSHYSPNFPQLTQRAQSISKTWKAYNYPKMDFDIKGVRLLAPDTATAQVTWNVEAQNISTTKFQTISKSYLIKFVKESNQWRIVSLDKAE